MSSKKSRVLQPPFPVYLLIDLLFLQKNQARIFLRLLSNSRDLSVMALIHNSSGPVGLI